MKKFFNCNRIIIILIIIFLICFSLYLSKVMPIKNAVSEPNIIKPNMYVIHYDYYAKCWGILKGCNLDNNEANYLKIISGPDPEKDLSSGLCYSNSFIVYGSIEKTEENLFSLDSEGWDIIVRDDNGIHRSYISDKKDSLTIYDYKWIDIIN